MGTRNAIVWVPTILGHYSSPILQTSDKLTSWTMAPPPACRSFPKNKPPRSPPYIFPKRCIQDVRGGRGSAVNNQITMTIAAADMLAAIAMTTSATAMMATATTATVTTATATTTTITTTVAAAKKTTMTYGDGNDV